jgi:hypothetical protein
MKDINDGKDTQLGVGSIRNEVNFWEDADEFLNTQLPKEFEENLKQFIINKNYNENEFRLFKCMLEQKIGYFATIFFLKHY